MELNADFNKRVLIHTDEVEWVASPMAGVSRRMLDRIGGEVARATSVVRYDPGSRFSSHVHGGGEEFVVGRYLRPCGQSEALGSRSAMPPIRCLASGRPALVGGGQWA